VTSSEGKREEAGTEGRDLYGALSDVEFREQIGSLILAILVYLPTRVESKSAQSATHSTVKRTVGAGEAEAKSRSELGWFCTATTVPIHSPPSRPSSAHHSLFRSYLSVFSLPQPSVNIYPQAPIPFCFCKPNKFLFGKLYASGVPRRASCSGDAHASFCAPARRSCSSISLQRLYQPQCNADNGTSHVASHG
jgi:hypothetical protein